MLIRRKKLVQKILSMRSSLDPSDACCTKDFYYRKGAVDALLEIAKEFGIDFDK